MLTEKRKKEIQEYIAIFKANETSEHNVPVFILRADLKKCIELLEETLKEVDNEEKREE